MVTIMPKVCVNRVPRMATVTKRGTLRMLSLIHRAKLL